MPAYDWVDGKCFGQLGRLVEALAPDQLELEFHGAVAVGHKVGVTAQDGGIWQRRLTRNQLQ